MYIRSEYPFKCCVLQPAKEVGQLILYKEKIPTPIFTRYSILDLYDQSKTGLKPCLKSNFTCRNISCVSFDEVFEVLVFLGSSYYGMNDL